MREKAKTILDAVYKQRCDLPTRESYRHAMHDAALLAVGSLMLWEESDLRHPFDEEQCYSLAVSVGNMSYIKAYENRHDMKPYFANNVDPTEPRGYLHMVSTRRRDRLAVGSRVKLPEDEEGKRWIGEVTSLTPERVVITVRETVDQGREYVRKVRRLYKLDHEKCAAMFPAPKVPKRKKASDSEGETAEGSANA